ncbi:MAG: hypothetical protein WBV94_04440 [Blastocatellia bacterium]
MQIAAVSKFLLMNSRLSSRYLIGPTHANQGRLYNHAVNQIIKVAQKEELISVTGRQLSTVADRAYNLRDLDAVREASSLLLSLDSSRNSEFHQIGRYYQALMLYKLGIKDKAQAILESIAGSQIGTCRAKALASLAAFKFYSGDLNSSMYYRVQALHCATNISPDPFIVVEAKRAMAILKSLNGNHNEALSDLESVLLPAKDLSICHPALYFDCVNSYAVELNELGRVQEARHYSEIALASQYSMAYPEWRETGMEIARRGYRALRSIVTVAGMPAPEPENVVHLDAWPVDRAAQEPPSNGTARVRDFREWKTEMAKGQKKEKPKEYQTADEKIDEILDLLTRKEVTEAQVDSILNILRGDEN